MARQYLGEGATVEEAILEALKGLQAARDDVEVEVIQKPFPSILPWKRKPAVVRLTLKEKIVKKEENLGTVSIVDGQLLYSPPQTPKEAPRLKFGPEFQVQYQGEIKENEVTLTEGLQSLQITTPQEQPPELHYEIRKDAQKLKAELFWKRSPGVKHTLADAAPANQLRLFLKKTLLEAPVLTKKTVQEIVALEGLAYGVDLSKITAELLNLKSGLITVAQGRPPVPPQQPTISYVFRREKPSINPEALRIDHYEVHGIQSVKPGEILAVKNPGRPGEEGIDVYGQTIAVTPLQKLEISVGEGAALSADGLQAVATLAGLPVLQNGVVKVLDVFELAGDADVSTGNITMDGAIVIKGSVLENVKIESKNGDIVVHGLASGAVLRTAGSITVFKNVLRSELYAGGDAVFKIRLAAMLHTIGNQLDGLLKAYEAIVQQAGAASFENLIKHLLELKFHDLPKEVKEFSAYFQEVKDRCSRELVILKEGLTKNLLGTGPLKIENIGILQELHVLLRAQEVILESESLAESNASVGYLQNSRIEASGEVEVSGQGCYYSVIVAGRGFKMPRGVFRGGEVTVTAGEISAKEFGGPTGVATKVQIVKEGTIKAGRIYPNVTISVGDQSFRFGEETSQVKAFLSEGSLTVYSGLLKIHG